EREEQPEAAGRADTHSGCWRRSVPGGERPPPAASGSRRRGRGSRGGGAERSGAASSSSTILDIPFPSSREATVALRSLSPDREPRRGGISKRLSVSGSTLSVRWSADEARILRVSVNSFLDHLSLVVETMELFGPPVDL
uniref:L antigen family member 3 n=1 Tax=Xiphophorus couchianus TaxID=32473 RepID=A0A3B5MBY4_9TELE